MNIMIMIFLGHGRPRPLLSNYFHFNFFFHICSSLLLQALFQLYFDPVMERKNVAQKWLTQAQASAQAWQFCWALLGPDKVRCFCSDMNTVSGSKSRNWLDVRPD